LPEWKDNIDFAVSKKELFDALEATYPRFVLHPLVRELVGLVKCTGDISEDDECLLFPSQRGADACCAFLARHFPQLTSKFGVRCVTHLATAPRSQQIFAVTYPKDKQEKAMKFWTFTGEGISSRLAESCLLGGRGIQSDDLGLPSAKGHILLDYYLQNQPLTDVSLAKDAIRKRFAGVIDEQGGNIRGVPAVSHTDVYLFPTGMSAVWNAHQLLLGTVAKKKGMERVKTAHVNILYVDSYKLLELTSHGYYFFSNETIDDLESLLATGTPECPAVLGIFTDFPANPNLQSADLPRLRALADEYGIPLFIDETVGCHLNVQVTPYADVIIGSLTKVFSGFGNVLGGALMLNPSSRFFNEFKQHMQATYEDNYFDRDVLVMEVNSRGMEDRVAVINRNAEALSDMLYALSATAGIVKGNCIVKEVFYPKYQNPENYRRCCRISAAEKSPCMFGSIGYSGLLSVSFTSLDAAKVFYSALPCYKGPSLGTVFTLATPFTAIGFPPEKMAWAKEHHLDETLVRISVGTEELSSLMNGVALALKKAEEFCAGKV